MKIVGNWRYWTDWIEACPKASGAWGTKARGRIAQYRRQTALRARDLQTALKGASVVVDVTNSPSWEDAAVLKFFRNINP